MSSDGDIVKHSVGRSPLETTLKSKHATTNDGHQQQNSIIKKKIKKKRVLNSKNKQTNKVLS
jgi:hypothetical protein